MLSHNSQTGTFHDNSRRQMMSATLGLPVAAQTICEATHLLMLDPSLRVFPVAPVFFDRSDPAKSTRLSLEFRLVSRVTPSLSSSVVFFSTFNRPIHCDPGGRGEGMQLTVGLPSP